MSRAWWVFLLYGLFAIGFGLFALFQPQSTVWVLIMAFGLLALADGVVSLLSVFRKDVALPNWLLLLYAAASIGFGLLAIFQAQMVAPVLVWMLAMIRPGAACRTISTLPYSGLASLNLGSATRTACNCARISTARTTSRSLESMSPRQAPTYFA